MGEQRIILVDSDENCRKNLKSLLSKDGYLVIGEAADGLTAIKMVRSRQPDLVLLSILLPGTDGLAVARIIQEDKLCPVILTAESYRQELLDKAIQTRVQGFLVKPLEESTLIPALEIAMSNYQEITLLERENKRLEEKLAGRKIVDKAKGILMETMNITEEQAFKKLQKQSMNKRVSMQAVAEAVIMAHSLKIE